MSEFHLDTNSFALRRNMSNSSLAIPMTSYVTTADYLKFSSNDHVRRDLDLSTVTSVAAVQSNDGNNSSPVKLSAEYVASARQHKPLRDRLLQLDQQNELNTIKLVALREEKDKRSDQFRRELAEAEKDYFMRQNIELKQTLEKKNAEIAEFVELITNLNGIVLHLKSLSSNLKEEVQRYEIKVETLNAEGEKMRTELADGVKMEAEMEACADLNKKKISDLEIANNDLNRKVNEDKAAIETLQSENKSKTEQFAKIEAELAGCKKQLAETDAKCVSQQSELDRLVLLVRMSSGVKEQMETSLQEAQMNADRLALECNQLSSRLDSYLALEEKQSAIKETMESALMESSDAIGKLLRAEEKYVMRSNARQEEKSAAFEKEIQALRATIQELTSSRNELQLQLDFSRGECSQLLEEKQLNTASMADIQSLLRGKEEAIETLEKKMRGFPEESPAAGNKETKVVDLTHRDYDGVFQSILKDMDDAIHTYTASLVLGEETKGSKALSEPSVKESEMKNTAVPSGALGNLTDEKKNVMDGNKEFVAFAARIVEIRKSCANLLQPYRSANLTSSSSGSVVFTEIDDDAGERRQSNVNTTDSSTSSALPNAVINTSSAVLSFEYSPGNDNLELWEMREQVDKTDKTLINVINDLRLAEEEKLSLRQSVAELTAQLSQLQLQLDEKVRSNDLCREQATRLEDACAELRAQNAILHTNIVTQQAQYSSLESNSSKYVKEIELLTRELEIGRQKLSQEHESMAANAVKSAELIDRLSGELENSKKLLSQCESDMAANSLTFAKEIGAISRELENTRKQLTQCQEDAVVKSLKSAQDAEILFRELEVCKTELSQCLADMTARSAKASEDIDALKQDLENSRKQVSQSQECLVAHSLQSAEENENLSRELENSRNELSLCQASMAAHSLKSAEDINTLTRDLDNCRKELTQYQEKIVADSLKSAEENENLSRALNSSRAQISQCQAEMAAHSLKSVEEINSLQAELENSRKQVSQCQADIAVAMGLSNDLTAKLQRQSNELKLAKEESKRTSEEHMRLELEMGALKELSAMLQEDFKAQITMNKSAIHSQEQQELAIRMASDLSGKVLHTSIVAAVTTRFGEETILRNASILDTYSKLEELQQEKIRLEAERDAAVMEAKKSSERFTAESVILAQGVQTLKRDAFHIASGVKALRNEIAQSSEAFLSSEIDGMKTQLLRAVALHQNRAEKMQTAALLQTKTNNDLKEKDTEIARLSRSERVLSDTLKQKEQQLLQLMRAQEDALRLQEEASFKEIYDLRSKLSDAQDALRVQSTPPPPPPPTTTSPSPREEDLTKQLESCKASLNESRAGLQTAESNLAILRRERDAAVADLQQKIQRLEKEAQKIQKSTSAATQAASEELRVAKDALSRATAEKEQVKAAFQEQIRSLQTELAEKSDHLDRLAVQYGEAIEELAARHLADASAATTVAGVGDGQVSNPTMPQNAQLHSSSEVPLSSSASSFFFPGGQAEVAVEVAPATTAPAQEADTSGDSVLNVLNWFR